MLDIRHYHCLSCGKEFISSDGVICLPSSGVKCPHCGSTKTIENPVKGAIDAIKFLFKKGEGKDRKCAKSSSLKGVICD